MENHTFLAFRPGLKTALTVKDVTTMLDTRKRRDVMAGGMMCSKGHRITHVKCKTRQNHFRHIGCSEKSDANTKMFECSCSKSRVHSNALQMLRDHDYHAQPIEFVQWYSCNIHYNTAYTATSDVYPVLEVTEWSKDGKKRFRSDLVYVKHADDSIDKRIEVWHTHRTQIDGARTDILFLESDATHVQESLLRGEYIVGPTHEHLLGCTNIASPRSWRK